MLVVFGRDLPAPAAPGSRQSAGGIVRVRLSARQCIMLNLCADNFRRNSKSLRSEEMIHNLRFPRSSLRLVLSAFSSAYASLQDVTHLQNQSAQQDFWAAR